MYQIGGGQMGTRLVKLTEKERFAVAEILLGAVWVDGSCDVAEFQTVVDILMDLNCGEIDEELMGYMRKFKPNELNLEATCGKLNFTGSQDRRLLLSLIAEVIDADDLHHLDEDSYLKEVACFLGACPEEFEDLTVELVELKGPPRLPQSQ